MAIFNKKPINVDKMNATIKNLALENFRIETLKTRNSDGLDFYEVAVWQVKAALEEAYKAGFEAAQKRQVLSTRDGVTATIEEV